MKLCRFVPPPGKSTLPESTSQHGAHAPRWGILEGDYVHGIAGDLFGPREMTGRSWLASSVRLLTPVMPSKVVCVGRNYREHAAELGNDVPAEPLIFLKPPSSVISHGEAIVMPAISQRVDYEGELAVVIGRQCSRLAPREDVGPYILGYACLNDVTARDLQKRDVQFTRAKGFDTFCPFGPIIETELNWRQASVETRVNGARKQFTPLAEMIFSVDVIIGFIAQVMTLLPGDVIATGTPAGVGPLAAGDIVEVTVSGIGTLSNAVAGPQS